MVLTKSLVGLKFRISLTMLVYQGLKERKTKILSLFALYYVLQLLRRSK